MKNVKQEYPRLVDIMEKAGLDHNDEQKYEIGKKIFNTLDKEGYRFYKENNSTDSRLLTILSIPFWLLYIACLYGFCKTTKTKMNTKTKVGKFTTKWANKILKL